MKTEAIGNAVPRQAESGAAGRHAVDGSSFSAMLQAIFAARMQSTRAATGGTHDAVPAEALRGDASAKEAELPIFKELHTVFESDARQADDQVIAEGSTAGIEDALAPAVVHVEQETGAAINVLAGGPFFVFPLQQWEELPPAAQELVKLILAGLLGENTALKGDHVSPGRLAALQVQASVTTAESGFTAMPKISQQLLEQQLPEFRQQLPARITELTRGGAEIENQEKQLLAGPLLTEGGLSSQSSALLASYLQEGKPLAALPQAVLTELGECLVKMEICQEGDAAEPGEKNGPLQSLLTRVEKFLQSLLSCGREEANGPAGQSGNMLGEQQLKGQTLPAEQNLLIAAGENDGGRFGAVLSGRAEGPAGGRGFAAFTPPFQPNEVMAQVMERVALLARPGVQELRLHLQPDYLGNILIRLRNIKGVLSAEVLTQHLAVKELLEGQLDKLRQRFQDMNLAVEEFRVLVGGGEREGRGEAQYAPEEPRVDFYTGKADLQHPVTVETAYRDGKQHLVNYLA